jgi:hypothetical protein
MSSDNITTTNRQAMLSLIQQADETGEVSALQQQTQHISATEDRTDIIITSTDGETFDTSSSISLTSGVTINSSDSITSLGADINVSTGEIFISTSSEDTSENANMTISYQSLQFQSSNVGNVIDMAITPNGLSISGTIDDEPLTIINIRSLPTSASGLEAGTIYKDGSGFLKIS